MSANPYPPFAREAVARVYASLQDQPVDEWLATLLRAHGLRLVPECMQDEGGAAEDAAYLEAAGNLFPPPPLLPPEWGAAFPPLPPAHTYLRSKADARAGTWRGEQSLLPAKHEANWQAARHRKQFMPAYARLVGNDKEEDVHMT